MIKRTHAPAQTAGLITLGTAKVDTKGVASSNEPDEQNQQKPDLGLTQD